MQVKAPATALPPVRYRVPPCSWGAESTEDAADRNPPL